VVETGDGKYDKIMLTHNRVFLRKLMKYKLDIKLKKSRKITGISGECVYDGYV
jgi:hypothetical protein